MICLEIIVNGERACLAGVGDTGVVSAHVTWTKRHTRNDGIDQSQSETTGENLFCMVGGLAHEDEEYSAHLRWLYQKLIIGDEVTIRIVESETPDPPFRKERTFDGCAFCGKPPSKDLKIVAGAGANICKDCTEELTGTLSKEPQTNGQESQIHLPELVCSNCGVSKSADTRIIAGLHGNICRGCLESCYEALH